MKILIQFSQLVFWMTVTVVIVIMAYQNLERSSIAKRCPNSGWSITYDKGT